ncbi:MAG: nuclear transport factor 2 family protein [Chloroflexota bacterium]
MPGAEARELVERYVELMNTQGWDRFEEVLHPDYVEEYPQSGERIHGIANARAVRSNYPGGLEPDRIGRAAVISGDERRWVMTPGFQLVRMAGQDDRITFVLRTLYPDGSYWFVVALGEVRDGLLAHMTTYFAPEFPAPKWRAPFRETTGPGGA